MSSDASKNGPSVSVIIPLYNHERYIAEAVHSVLNQTSPDLEVVIINDGSTDDSEAIVKGIRDERIRYFAQDNQGAPATLNKGIGLAKGEYISILNSDDVYHPERLAECRSVLDADRGLSGVFSLGEMIDRDGNPVMEPQIPAYDWEKRDPSVLYKNEQSMVLDLLAGNFLLTTSNLFCRRGVFSRIGTFMSLKYTHDYEFFFRICSHEGVRLLPRPLFKYRIHEMNTVKSNAAEVNFEVGLVLSHVLLNYDLKRLFPDGDRTFQDMTKFFDSLYACRAEKMILSLLVFGILQEPLKKTFLQVLSDDRANIFRDACERQLQQSIDEWKESQKMHLEISRLHNQISGMEEQLEQTRERLKIRNEDVQNLLNSRSYRLGRALTWPLRKIRGG